MYDYRSINLINCSKLGLITDFWYITTRATQFFDQFFPFYKILADFSAIFIISSPQFEIFMGEPPTVNHLNFL